MVPVEQPCREEADHDAREYAVVDLRLITGLVDLAREHDRRHGLEHRLHHEVADDRGQRRRTVGLLRESDGDADGEQEREVAEDRVARRAHRLEEGSDDGRLDAPEQIVLAEP